MGVHLQEPGVGLDNWHRFLGYTEFNLFLPRWYEDSQGMISRFIQLASTCKPICVKAPQALNLKT